MKNDSGNKLYLQRPNPKFFQTLLHPKHCRPSKSSTCNSNSEQARAYSKVGPHGMGAASAGLQEDSTGTHRPASRQDPRSLTLRGNATSSRSCPRGAGAEKAIAAASRGPLPPWPRGRKVTAIPAAYETLQERSAPPRGLCESTTLRAETTGGNQSNLRSRENGPPQQRQEPIRGQRTGDPKTFKSTRLLPPPGPLPQRIAGSGNTDRSASPSQARPMHAVPQ